MSSLVCSCFVFILCFWFSFGNFYAHVHYLDCCIWVLCHHNQCEPTAARMVHAQRCVYAAAVIWLRIHRVVSVSHTTSRNQVNARDSIHFLTEMKLTEPNLVILSSKTALLWLLWFFCSFFNLRVSYCCALAVEPYKLYNVVWQHAELRVMKVRFLFWDSQRSHGGPVCCKSPYMQLFCSSECFRGVTLAGCVQGQHGKQRSSISVAPRQRGFPSRLMLGGFSNTLWKRSVLKPNQMKRVLCVVFSFCLVNVS